MLVIFEEEAQDYKFSMYRRVFFVGKKWRRLFLSLDQIYACRK